MGKYGDAAVLAAGMLAHDEHLSPREAWMRAVAQLFPHSPSSQRKGCPRDAFLGLCEMGAIVGVKPGAYTQSVKNKGYVARALPALRADPALASDEKRLWTLATSGADTRPNGQMDVLVTLWRRQMITTPP
jgi:hypothetical protein